MSTSLLGAATSFQIVALLRGGVDWITTIAGGDRNCAAAVIADATHGPNDGISCQNRGQQQRRGEGVVGWALKNWQLQQCVRPNTLINKGVVVASIVKECLNSKRIFYHPFFGREVFPPPYRPQHVSIDAVRRVWKEDVCVSGGWNVDRAQRWRVVIENSTTTINVSLNLLDASKDGGYIFKNKSPKMFNNFNAAVAGYLMSAAHVHIGWQHFLVVEGGGGVKPVEMQREFRPFSIWAIRNVKCKTGDDEWEREKKQLYGYISKRNSRTCVCVEECIAVLRDIWYEIFFSSTSISDQICIWPCLLDSYSCCVLYLQLFPRLRERKFWILFLHLFWDDCRRVWTWSKRNKARSSSIYLATLIAFVMFT